MPSPTQPPRHQQLQTSDADWESSGIHRGLGPSRFN